MLQSFLQVFSYSSPLGISFSRDDASLGKIGKNEMERKRVFPWLDPRVCAQKMGKNLPEPCPDQKIRQFEVARTCRAEKLGLWRGNGVCGHEEFVMAISFFVAVLKMICLLIFQEGSILQIRFRSSESYVFFNEDFKRISREINITM